MAEVVFTVSFLNGQEGFFSISVPFPVVLKYLAKICPVTTAMVAKAGRDVDIVQLLLP